jgi:transposase
MTGPPATGPGRGWLAELDLPPVSREIITDCLAAIDGLAPVIDRLDSELHQRAKADPRVKVLQTLPGVGEFTALVMLAEIGDIARFGSSRKLASWAGLTPTVRGSDRTVRHGHRVYQSRGHRFFYSPGCDRAHLGTSEAPAAFWPSSRPFGPAR